MIRSIATLALTTTLGVGFLSLAVPSDATPMPTPKSGLYIPCEYEDSNNCVWDAKHMGNGEGRSFIATSKGKVIFLPHRAAHALTEPGVW